MKSRYIVVASFLLTFLATLTILAYQKDIISYLSIYFPLIQTVKNKPSTQIHPVTKEQNSEIFYGASVDMSQILPTSQHYVVNARGEDLIDIASSLGINLFRITSTQNSFPGPNGSTYTKRQWDRVLDKMKLKGIKAIILVESPTLTSRDYSANYLKLVDSYIKSGVAENDDVYAIDIRNEPLINNLTIRALSSAAKSIKDKYPNTLITVGGWKTQKPDFSGDEADPFVWQEPAVAKNLSGFIDFYSLHLYGYDVKHFGVYPNAYNLTKVTVDKVRPFTNNKPILIEEFGAGNGDGVTDQQTLGSEALQANVYADVYQSILDNSSDNLIGSVLYTLYPRDRNTTGWNILKNNKTADFYTAAYVLQKFATGKSNASLSVSNKSFPDDFLLTNNDNGKTITLKVNDILGFRLNLTSNYSYQTRTSSPSLFLQTEPITRENQTDYYDAVWHAQKPGKTTIRVVGKNKLGETIKFSSNIVILND